MDDQLHQLYRELLSIIFPDGRAIFERIGTNDLCLTGYLKGKNYTGGLLIYGQAVNGWQNTAFHDTDALIQEVLSNADDYHALYPVVDPRGWRGEVDGIIASYYYKRSKFWKLNYQVATRAADPLFQDFYIRNPLDNCAFDAAWSQSVVWSNLYKVTFSKGGNPDSMIQKSIHDVSIRIVLREIDLLQPTQVLFNTGKNYFEEFFEDRFGLHQVSETGNVLYAGQYSTFSGSKCKMVVCKRPDEWKAKYTNNDIIREAEDILKAFE